MKTWSVLSILAAVVAFACPWCVAAEAAGQDRARPHIVFLIGEDEYKTETTLPAFARSELEPNGLRVSLIFASKDDPNDFPGMVQALAGILKADVLVPEDPQITGALGAALIAMMSDE